MLRRLKHAGAYVRFDPLRRKRRPEGAPTKFKPLGPELAAAMEIAVANSKEPLRAIAGRFGMPVQTLRYALRRRGLWVRRKRGSQWSAQRKLSRKRWANTIATSAERPIPGSSVNRWRAGPGSRESARYACGDGLEITPTERARKAIPA